ncbi:E3 ubiquitin-protein ligase COP1 [Gracilariopsis chorda]|uniref:E3 ubiquitin-protein ligase COP1 n=1 Tax=Gracilariopsis chorda TaxID=448386 RepID=A0A2V3ISW4_9FLOR|nr:E3 ubiquitin-protein ligase COP1 [Gracilariopsis chorda]|eukprot:PXF44200.1 E3 ubiquitin-protein ligase COP1 [Gracilariopsis chorda]
MLSRKSQSASTSASSPRCPICRSAPTDPFVTRCAHTFCYEQPRHPPRTPSPRAPPHPTSPPRLNPRPRPPAQRPDAAARRARAQAVADAALLPPTTAPPSSAPPRTPTVTPPATAPPPAPVVPPLPAVPGDARALLAAGENLSAEQLAGIIAQLQQKLEQKEDVERRVETALLLDFLHHVRKEKQTIITRLRREVALLEDDVNAAELQRARFRTPDTSSATSCASDGRHTALDLRNRRTRCESPSSNPAFIKKRKRLSHVYDLLQNHYFSTVASQHGERRSTALQSFKDDISKLTQYTRLRDSATLMHVARVPDAPGRDVFKASNIVSSIEFDRDSEFLATAGVTKRIKIFEFSSVTRNLTDVHYPIREIKANEKLSWICWNPYIRHHLVSSDYEGVVALWDINLGKAYCEFEEHESRVWSVDFCPTKPTVFASGSDDCRVKLWCTSQRNSVLTIDNRGANVCSVKFHPTAPEKLAFGSVDHGIHYYDLRKAEQPLHVFKSHSRTVSYVKFMSPSSLVSASVDSTVKLWDLKTMSLERNFTGHKNDRNFVGLSVTPDYIACGSEENTVYCYYKAIPRPFATYRFSSVDPLTGKEMQGDDYSQFVSSVCWCPRDPTKLIAANSLGNVKVLSLESEDSDEEKDEKRHRTER